MAIVTFKQVGNRRVNVPRGTIGSLREDIPDDKLYRFDSDVNNSLVFSSNLTPREVLNLDTVTFLDWLDKASEASLRSFSEWDFS